MLTVMDQNGGRRPLWAAVLLVLVLLLLAGLPAATAAPPGPLPAAADENVELVGHIGGWTLDVAIMGNYAYVGEGPRLAILDIANPAQPVLVGKSPVLPGLVYAVVVSGNHAYVAADRGGLWIIDISNPAAPTTVGAYDTPNNAYGLAVAGNYAYVADWVGGLRIINVANPAAPAEVGFYDTPGAARDVTVVGNYAYVADNGGGLRILNIATPAAPVEAGFFDPAGILSIHGLTVAGSYAYLAADDDGLRIVNVATPAAPVEVGAYNIGRPTYDVSVAGDLAYVASNDDGLRIINVATPATPSLVKLHDTPGYAKRVAVAGDYAYVADSYGGLRIVNVSVPSTPTNAATYEPPTDVVGVAVAGDYAYLANYNGPFHIVKVANPAAPLDWAVYETLGRTQDVAVAGAYAYAAEDSGLESINVANPAAPYQANFINRSGVEVVVSGNAAYLARGTLLTIIDISDPLQLDEFSSLQVPTGWVSDVAVAGNYAYVAAGGLRIANVADPALPVWVGGSDFHAQGLAVAGNYVYMGYYAEDEGQGESFGLRIINVADPAHPTFTGEVVLPGMPYDVTVAGNLAYVAGGNYGLYVIDVSNPAAPVEVGHYQTVEDAEEVSLVGDLLCLAGGKGGLIILRYTPSASPTISGFTPASGAVGATVTVNGTHLAGATAVTFNSTAATTFNVVSATQLTAVVPAGATTGKIAVTTGGGTATSAVNFVVLQNHAPNDPTNPSPANAAGNVAVTAALGWSGSDPDSDPLTYEVRFGTANPPPQVVADQSATSYDPPGDLASGTTYYWKIIANDGRGGTTPGPVWSFTTAAGPATFPDVFYASPTAVAVIGGISAQGTDILRYTKSSNAWAMFFDGSDHSLVKNVTAFALLDDGSLLLVFTANQAITGLGTATPYDVVKFTPNNPNAVPLGAGAYSWYFQGKVNGLTTAGEKIDAVDLDGNQLLLSTSGAASVPKPGGGALKPADEDVFVRNMGTNQWESVLRIDGSKMTGMAVEDINGLWDDPQSGDYYITIVGAFNLGGLRGTGKSIVKLTPNGGATVFTPSLVSWLASGATYPTSLDGLELVR